MPNHSIIEEKYKIHKTIPVYTNGNITDSQQNGWFVAHGHGQRADRIINKWDEFDNHIDRVVSVEGSNRFYWNENRNLFATTWMTSRFRLDDIADNNDYFDNIYKSHISGIDRKLIFGFSQGGTTLWRWIHDRKPEFDVFINYAGWIPEDIDLSNLKSYMENKKLVFVYGDDDKYLKPERINGLKQVVDRSQLSIEIVNYKGEHKVYRSVLKDLALKYA